MKSKKKVPRGVYLETSHFVRSDRIKNILLFLFLFFLPTQLGKHIFFDFSYIFGIRIDYLAPTIYITDILAAILIITYRKHVLTLFQNKRFFIFCFLISLSIFFSTLIPISLYRFVKIFELLALLIIFKKVTIKPGVVLWGFFAGVIVQTVLVILQFLSKQSLQGVFYWLGERMFILSTPGVAKASLEGVEILRPYGTFSHPNSLGGFYLLVYVFFLFSKIEFRPTFVKNILLFCSTLLIFFSFSKSSLLVFIIVNILFVFFNIRKSTCSFCLLSRVFGLIVLGLFFTTATADPNSLGKRVELIEWSLALIAARPLFGVGPGAFVYAAQNFKSMYPYVSPQPVHNIILLLISELGLIGGTVALFNMVAFIAKYRNHLVFIACILVILATGMTDHYWISLQQNWILVGVLLGVLTNSRYLS